MNLSLVQYKLVRLIILYFKTSQNLIWALTQHLKYFSVFFQKFY